MNRLLLLSLTRRIGSAFDLMLTLPMITKGNYTGSNSNVLSREGSLGMLSEPLTSHLRTIVRIKSFKFSLLPPKGRQKYDAALPEIILDVLSWDVRSGDRTETVYWPGAREISHNDELAAQVLIEWWGGRWVHQVRTELTPRDGSPSMTDQVTKEWKARRAAKSPTPEQSLHTPVISQTKVSTPLSPTTSR